MTESHIARDGEAGPRPFACSAHSAPWLDFRDVEALARVLRWEDYTVIHSCEGRLEIVRV